MAEIRVVHYMNQFFGQRGGEDQAQRGPEVVEGPIGSGTALAERLGSEFRIVATLICGDDYKSSELEVRAAELLALVRPLNPDLIVAGPAFNAGRYGITCASFCIHAHRELGIPAVAAVSEKSPAADIYRRDTVLARSGDSARDMATSLDALARVARKVLEQGEASLNPDTDPYLVRGIWRNTVLSETAAERAINMLVAKLADRPFQTEVPPPDLESVQPAPPIRELTEARVGLVTTGGIVLKGNPERLRSHVADRYGRVPLQGVQDLEAPAFEAHHGGYFHGYVNADPDRMVPLDALREMARDGAIAGVHDTLFSLAGTGTSPQVSKQLGAQMAAEFKKARVNVAVITST